MSAIHTGSIAVRIVNGRPQFTGTSEDRIITDWSALETGQPVHVTIPTQRAGNAYDTAVLQPNGGEPR